MTEDTDKKNRKPIESNEGKSGGILKRMGKWLEADVPCPNCGTMNKSDALECKECGVSIAELEEQRRIAHEKRLKEIEWIKLSSGYNFEGFDIVEYIDFITIESVLGMGFLRSIAAGFSDFTGTESGVLNAKLEDVRANGMRRIKEKAVDLGGNALIGLDLDYTMFGDSMIALICNGTVVKIKPKDSIISQ